MVKRSPLQVIRAGTVHPGKYLVLVGGLTADVEEAMQAGRRGRRPSLVGVVFLPDVHPDVVSSIGGTRREDPGEALGVIEAPTVAATIDAADAGVKGARVTIRDLRLADGLGGKGYVLFGGEVAEVEAAVGHGVARAAASGQEVTHVVISQLHAEMQENLEADPRFSGRVGGVHKPPPAGAVRRRPSSRRAGGRGPDPVGPTGQSRQAMCLRRRPAAAAGRGGAGPRRASGCSLRGSSERSWRR